MPHHRRRYPIMLSAAMITAAACGRDTPMPRAAIPNVNIPIEEPVSIPVRITAREVPPPETG
jgi:hypothetical protein